MSIEMDSSHPETPPAARWDELTMWAIEDTDESWGKIDTVIESVADDERYVLHAVVDLSHENQNIRDLSASILEATSAELAEETIKSLKHMLGDEHFYAKFRAACALVKHDGYNERQEDVKLILQEALTDEDEEVVTIAQQYLGQLAQQTESDS